MFILSRTHVDRYEKDDGSVKRSAKKKKQTRGKIVTFIVTFRQILPPQKFIDIRSIAHFIVFYLRLWFFFMAMSKVFS